MVKKIFTKMTLASTLFLGSVLGASIVNGIENKNDASVQNRTVNVKRSGVGESEVEYLSFVITFDKNDPKTNFTKVIYDKDDPTKAAVTVLFEKVNYTDSKLGEDYVVEATIEKNTAVYFTPGEGYEIDKITTLATGGGAFGSNSPTLTNVKSKSSGNRVELTPIDKSKQVKVKNFTYSYTYCYNMTIEYHKSVFTQKFDDTTHWIGCDCGTKKDVVNHTWDTRVFTTAPTNEAPGEAEYTCKCGKTKTEIAYPSVQDSIAEVTLVNSLTYNGIDQTQEIEG